MSGGSRCPAVKGHRGLGDHKGYPLLWETTLRFKQLPPPLALALVVGVLALALTLAARRGLGPVAWVHTIAALASGLGLLVATQELTTVAAALLAHAALVELLVRRPSWSWLRWLAAGALDLGVLVMVLLVGRPQGPPGGYPALSPSVAVVLALLLPALYLVRVAGGALRSRRSVTFFETLQLATAVALGFEGASRIITAQAGSTFVLGLAALALGLAGYSVAIRLRVGRGAYDVTPFVNVARGVYEISCSPGGDDMEYFVQARTGGKDLFFPATAPAVGQTVVVLF